MIQLQWRLNNSNQYFFSFLIILIISSFLDISYSSSFSLSSQYCCAFGSRNNNIVPHEHVRRRTFKNSDSDATPTSMKMMLSSSSVEEKESEDGNDDDDKPKEKKLLIAVIGASGTQGGSVLRAFHRLQQQQQQQHLIEKSTNKHNGSHINEIDFEFQVRAITRKDPQNFVFTTNQHHNQIQAEVEVEEQVEIVQADCTNYTSIHSAIQNCHGLFIMTNFWPNCTMENELHTLEIIQRALLNTKSIRHVVLSTLEDTRGAITNFLNDDDGGDGDGGDQEWNVINEQYQSYVPHYDGKAIGSNEFVKQLSSSSSSLSSSSDVVTTANHEITSSRVITSFYYENFLNLYLPKRKTEDENNDITPSSSSSSSTIPTFTITLPMKPDSKMAMLAIDDFGSYIVRLFINAFQAKEVLTNDDTIGLSSSSSDSTTCTMTSTSTSKPTTTNDDIQQHQHPMYGLASQIIPCHEIATILNKVFENKANFEYKYLPPSIYSQFGFPGCHDAANMFRYQMDCVEECLNVRRYTNKNNDEDEDKRNLKDLEDANDDMYAMTKFEDWVEEKKELIAELLGIDL